MSGTGRPIVSVAEFALVLRRPLEFAARRGFSNAALADGLGPFLAGVLDRAAGLAPVLAREAELRAGLDRWADADEAVRAALVRRWCGLLESLEAPEPQRRSPAPAEPPPDRTEPARERRRSEPPPQVIAGPRCRTELDAPLISLRGVGPRTADRLAERGLRSVRDLLGLLPRRYSRRPDPAPIAALRAGDPACVVGRVCSHRGGWSRRSRRPTFRLLLEDASGRVAVLFFGLSPGYLSRRFPAGGRVLVWGTPTEHDGGVSFVHPEAEPLSEADDPAAVAGRVAPVYAEIEGVPPRTLRRFIDEALARWADRVPDGVPGPIALAHGLPPLPEALRQVHAPSDDTPAGDLARRRTPAWRRLIFGELFVFQVGIALRRRTRRGRAAPPCDGAGALLRRFLEGLPFSLTGAQRRVLDELRRDLAEGVPANRLVQGDVGSGKTVVAVAAACIAAEAGHQTALMVPTELLAEQHLHTVRRLLEPVGLTVELLTGSLRKRAREPVLRGLLSGSVDVVIGTHALVSEGVEFRSLGLAVVDEQHRFGVRQRLSLRRKGLEPHVVVMTATPIPRSLSLTLYGDLDVSLVDERPPGRGTVRTVVVRESEREAVYADVRRELQAGRQAFFVYPAVEESEDSDLRAATEMAARLAEGPLAGLSVGLVHGRVPPGERDAVMAAFCAGEIRALVATTVVEVGVDVPAATVMVVEHAERFGLAQLHQLRGRIGRGGDGRPSTCYLVAAEETTRPAEDRLSVLTATDDGFEIADADLLQRGPGEFLGTRQSGLPSFEVADLLRDGELLREARQAAHDLVAADPELAGCPEVRAAVRDLWAGRLELVDVG